MKTKNLGGDRLGSGAKMNVQMEGYARSTHDLSTFPDTTMSMGTLIPIHHSIVLAGDTRDIEIDAELMTHPTEGPLFGSFKLQVDVFSVDMRLYIAKLHMNLLETGLNMSDIKMPQIYMEANKIDWTKNPDNQQINPSCIFKYLGISGVGDTNDASLPVREFNAIPYLAYWDIYKNYYANKQEGKGAVLNSEAIVKTVTAINIWNNGTSTVLPKVPAAAGSIAIRRATEMVLSYTGAIPDPYEIEIQLSDRTAIAGEMFSTIDYGTGFVRLRGTRREYAASTATRWDYITDTEVRMPKVHMFDLKNIDEMKMDILADIKSNAPWLISAGSIEPYGLPLDKDANNKYTKLSSQEGLALKTYQSDLFNNWLNTEWIDGVNGVNARSAIQTDIDGKFTIDNFLLHQKMYDWLNRIAVAGGTVDDMMEVTYDVENRTRPEIPVYEGGLSKELVFQQVISNSATADQPLGTLAGRGILNGKHRGGKVRIQNKDTQHKIYMVIASLTPRIKYSQGNRWDTNLKTYDDLHKPAFDQIGFQDLITDQMNYADTKMSTGGGALITKSAGKQPSWINYQTEIDRVFGNFASQESEGWMVLDRQYEMSPTTKSISDLTTYIDPAKYNGVFAYEARDAQNVWAQFAIRDKAIRTMSANQIPRM